MAALQPVTVPKGDGGRVLPGVRVGIVRLAGSNVGDQLRELVWIAGARWVLSHSNGSVR